VTQILGSSEKVSGETGSKQRPKFIRIDKQNKAASVNENYYKAPETFSCSERATARSYTKGLKWEVGICPVVVGYRNLQYKATIFKIRELSPIAFLPLGTLLQTAASSADIAITYSNTQRD